MMKYLEINDSKKEKLKETQKFEKPLNSMYRECNSYKCKHKKIKYF